MSFNKLSFLNGRKYNDGSLKRDDEDHFTEKKMEIIVTVKV